MNSHSLSQPPLDSKTTGRPITSIPDEKNPAIEKLRQEFNNLLMKFSTKYKKDPFILLKSIPAKEAWRFFIDGYRQNVAIKGGIDYALIMYEATEQGFILATSKTFTYMLDVAKQHLTTGQAVDLREFSKELHAKILDGVKGTHYDNKSEHKTNEYRGTNLHYISISDKAVYEDIYELLEKIHLGQCPWLKATLKIVDGIFLVSEPIRETMSQRGIVSTKLEDDKINKEKMSLFTKEILTRFLHHPESLIDVEMIVDSKDAVLERNNQVNKFILSFENKIKAATDDFDKFVAIVELTRDLNQYHPFIDGNTRTFVTLLLNYLLITHKLPPAILMNPNDFDFRATITLIKNTIQGCENTLKLAEKKTLIGKPDRVDGLVTDIKVQMYQSRHMLLTHFSSEKMDFTFQKYIEYWLSNNVLTLRYGSEETYFRQSEFEKAVLNIEKYLISKKPWKLSMFGGTSYVTDKGEKMSVPHKIQIQLDLIKKAKLKEKIDWEELFDLLIFFGRVAEKESKSNDEKRKTYYSLFSKVDSLSDAFGISKELVHSIWKRHSY